MFERYMQEAIQQLIEEIQKTQIHAEAVEAYKKGLQIDPSNIDLHIAIIKKASSKRAIATVRSVYSIAIEREDINPKIHYSALVAAYENNDVNLAQIAYYNAIKTHHIDDELIHEMAIAMGVVSREETVLLKKQYLDYLKARQVIVRSVPTLDSSQVEKKVVQQSQSVPMIVFIYEANSNDLVVGNLYEFVTDKKLKYPGHVIKQSLQQLTKHLPDLTLEQQHSIYLKICSLLTSENIEQFQVADCATSMYHIAKILTSDYFNLQSLEDTNLSPVLNRLLTKLLMQHEITESKDITSTLWAVAKLLQHGKLQQINEASVQQLLSAMIQKIGKIVNLNEIANTLWAIGIISTKISFQKKISLNQLALLILLDKKTSSLPLKEKNKIIVGITLLGLDEQPYIKQLMQPLIDECRPRPTMSPDIIKQIISPYVKKEELKDYDFEAEAFVHGFYVDLFAINKKDGNRIIFEFDGNHHFNSSNQKRFDEFRDEILNAKGFKVVRIDIRGYKYSPQSATSSFRYFSDSGRSEQGLSDNRKSPVDLKNKKTK